MESAPSTIDYALQNHNDHHHLGTRINIATRSAHAKLNKDLILRLPLALPPIAPTPSVYVSGLLHVAPIYIAFESLWRDIVNSAPKEDDEEDRTSNLDSPDNVSPGNQDQDSGEDDGRPRASERIHSVLKFLHLPVLQRSERLRDDIRLITGWTEDVVNEQISLASERGDVGEFISHIKRSVDRQPLVLLAYAWVLYMALFAGGRFIRGSLENAGPEFWSATSEPVFPSMVPCVKPAPSSPVASQFTSPDGYEGDDQLLAVLAPREKVMIAATTTTTTTTTASKPESTMRSMSPLQLFRFDTPQDGEDLKIEFKRRLIDSESRLTSNELEDIIHEATRIFDYMNSIVAQLDVVFAKSQFSAERNGGSSITLSNGSPSYVRSISSFLERSARLLIPGGGGGPRSRLKDSVAIAKERRVKALSKGNRSGAGSSITSLGWGGDRNWPNASGSVPSIGSEVGTGVRRKYAKKRAIDPAGDTSYEERETSSPKGGFDGVDEYESESEGNKLEKESSSYGVCPIVGVAKGEKHVRFLMTPTQEEDELRRKAAAGGSTGSSATAAVLRNGLVVLGLVGVVLGVGTFRVQ